MVEESALPQGQDPAQQQSASAPAPTPAAAPPAPSAPAGPGPGPWQQDLQQSFDPETAAQVDAFLRSHIQPRITQLEQTNAEARQMYDAFQADPYAADIAINRQLYGDEYANGLAEQIGRPDLMTQQPAPQPTAPQYTQPYEQGYRGDPGSPTGQAPQGDPRYEEMYAEWSEQRQQAAYDQAKAEFLTDPQYADINPQLFDPFVSGAETWEDAVNAYRAYAAQFAQNTAPPAEQPTPPPPAMGSEQQGGVGSMPAQPRETLSEAIDGIFSENKPAPPVFG